MSVILTDKIQPRTTGIALTVVGDTNVSGALTCTNFTASGDVSIGGTLTYEDVTNIDSVGLITARTGVRVTAGGVVVTAGVSTFTDDVKVNSTLTATEGLNVTAGVTTIAGTSTFAKKTTVNATLEATEGINVSAGVGTFASSATFGGAVTISHATPQFKSIDTDGSNDYSTFQNSSGQSVYNAVDLSLIHISSPRDRTRSRMPSSA